VKPREKAQKSIRRTEESCNCGYRSGKKTPEDLRSPEENETGWVEPKDRQLTQPFEKDARRKAPHGSENAITQRRKEAAKLKRESSWRLGTTHPKRERSAGKGGARLNPNTKYGG